MASASSELPGNRQTNQDFAKSFAEDYSAKTVTSLKSGRSFVPQRPAVPYPQMLHENDRAQYTARRYGPVMNVVVTSCRRDERGRWLYQAQDTDMKPVKLEGEDEPLWIPDTKLRRLEPAASSLEQIEPVADNLQQLEPVADNLQQLEPVADSLEQVEPAADGSGQLDPAADS